MTYLGIRVIRRHFGLYLQQPRQSEAYQSWDSESELLNHYERLGWALVAQSVWLPRDGREEEILFTFHKATEQEAATSEIAEKQVAELERDMEELEMTTKKLAEKRI
jgi:hypothetical protein